jgi:dTDP-glucose pyrophosphorylase
MAAGNGARYGGLKQVEGIGPAGETIVDYSIFDALRLGFQRVVFVLRRDIEGVFRDAVGRRIEQHADVRYAFQDEFLPPTPPVVARRKPWGTGHAVLSAASHIDVPFAVVNADDYYGYDSFRVLSDFLCSADADAALVGFPLVNTLSEFGPVKRGLCVTANGTLRDVTELENIKPDGDAATYTDSEGVQRSLTGKETVSMNMWGFQPEIFDYIHKAWDDFALANGESPTAEFYIPNVINSYVHEGEGTCRILSTSSKWFGVTYRDDLTAAVGRIQELVKEGLYPESLWS